jgi:hypothetical protein
VFSFIHITLLKRELAQNKADNLPFFTLTVTQHELMLELTSVSFKFEEIGMWSYVKLSMALCLCFAALTLVAQEEVTVPEHWSPYDAPSSYPAGTNVYIIQDGDTLWAIAGRQLGDPLLWPQIYQANPYIRDPDLIYPGDPLKMDVGVVVTEETIAETTPVTDEAEGTREEFTEVEAFAENDGDEVPEDLTNGEETVLDRAETFDFDTSGSDFVILPAGDVNDMECSTYIYEASSRKDKLPFELKVAGGENASVTAFAYGDIVYLNQGGSAGIQPGETYGVRRYAGPVAHPDSEKKRGALGQTRFMGFAIEQVGIIKILAVQETSSTAIIEAGCSEVMIGDFLVPYEEEPIPLITELPQADRYQPFNYEEWGTILFAEDNVYSLGKGHLVNIDRGIDNNVAPGDLFVIFRENPNTDLKRGLDLPPLYLGHGVALKVNDGTAVVKIIEAFKEIHVGDRIVAYASAHNN